jgi:hypothetical protein
MPEPISSNSPATKKCRRAITDAERKAIRRRWAELPAGDSKTHKAIIIWFQETHYHMISQSTVSEILSTKFAYLDTYTLRRRKNSVMTLQYN